jgi:hypothetical protein
MKMKKILFLLIACMACTGLFSQETVYVSTNGSGSGQSETEPTSFDMAVTQALLGVVKKIIVIGTLDRNSINRFSSSDYVFYINNALNLDLGEIIITGKQNATGAERAVLSARGSGRSVIRIRGTRIRFEYIEITGGEGDEGNGILVYGNAHVTLGAGAVVQGNSDFGIIVETGTTICTIDGGEVRNNSPGIGVLGQLILRNGVIRENISSGSGGGVVVGNGGQFTMTGGTITGNRTSTADSYAGGGVLVQSGGRFTMTGGSIIGNRAQTAGGGVYVISGGTFTQNGGTVSGNTAPQSPDIYR